MAQATAKATIHTQTTRLLMKKRRASAAQPRLTGNRDHRRTRHPIELKRMGQKIPPMVIIRRPAIRRKMKIHPTMKPMNFQSSVETFPSMILQWISVSPSPQRTNRAQRTGMKAFTFELPIRTSEDSTAVSFVKKFTPVSGRGDISDLDYDAESDLLYAIYDGANKFTALTTEGHRPNEQL